MSQSIQALLAVLPILVALGFPAMTAAMLGMMVQSTPVTFGAARFLG